MKVGDIICVSFDVYNDDWNRTGATRAIILTIPEYGHVNIEIAPLDCKNKKYSTVWIKKTTAVPEKIWNSPLFQLMQED